MEKGGRWVISPAGDFRSTHRYLPNTNVLETRFETGNGVVVLTDFMSVSDNEFRRQHLTADHEIVRLIRCESGSIEIEVCFSPRPGFAKEVVKLVDRGKLGLRVNAGHGMLALHGNVKFQVDGGDARTTIRMNAGDEQPLILTYSQASPEVMPLLSDAPKSLNRTVEWWAKWASSNLYDGPYRDIVLRSVFTLKLLEFPASGAFVAAPTTSLPEKVGGKLNWDYRYCWLRDASFIIEALCDTGFIAEAEAFSEWMMHATRRTQPKLMVMYDVYGNLGRKEKPLPGLNGYYESAPVNVGNGARGQSQLDTYGEVISGASALIKCMQKPADRETSKVLVGFGKYVCKHWKEPDAGIWEDRGKPIVHTHSRLLCWVALDSLIDLHKRELIGKIPFEKFTNERDSIRQAIETNSWLAAESTYTNEPGKLKLDATLLRMSIHNFEDASSDRMVATYKRISSDLSAGGSLLYRNLPDDGIPTEGAFGICGFWGVQFLALGGGSLADAEQAFQSLLETSNDLGLFAEETDPESKACVGNFPQAFTHVGLIVAALEIERRRKRENLK